MKPKKEKQIQIGIAMAILTILIAAAFSASSAIVLLHYKAFAQEQSSGLKVVSSNGFNDNNEFSPSYHIVGEVQNNGSQTATL